MFKNARLYRLHEPFPLAAAALEERLAARRFRPCGPLETATLGWTPPFRDGPDEHGRLVHASSGCLLICARRQERLLPGSVVTEALEERVSEIEGNEVRTVGRSERRRLREGILAELLPRAFTRSRRILAYLDTVAGWLVVDAASDKVAEDLVSLLRETLDSLPATPPRPPGVPATRMTDWLKGGRGPQGFELGDACELRDPRDTQSVIRCRGQDLAGEEIATHLRAGKQAVQLALDWHERLAFVLGEDLALKRLRLADELLEGAEEQDEEDPLVRFEAGFTLLAGELRGLIEELAQVFELTDQGAQTAPRAEDQAAAGQTR
ncbi:recombination-associated protein RdgC [Thioalkalicoccus limnaeus]|uniref:Recombination-associated protein RdgC n=1 Tax=Thioalkalicoccus limnaeus TaxID=120681 RepID=A0ABV4BKT5_9GAMM